MWKRLLLAMAAVALHGAVIRGTVVENQSGRQLARALVTLEPWAGTEGPQRSVRTNIRGVFQFPPVPAGTYVLTAAKTGFASFQYGQNRWKSAGVPIVARDEDSPLFTIRLPRFGAITGTVLDENDVGLPEYDVVAYRNSRPLQVAARARSDDRGVFRIIGLEPGSYLVRSVAKQFEDEGYLPTFAKETQQVELAYPVDVELDQQIDRVDVRPLPGRLFTFSVEIIPPGNMPVTMTLASDTGRQTIQGVSHRFDALPPGQYELFSEAPLEGRPGLQGDYRRVNISQDTSVRIVLHEVPPMQFRFIGGPPEVAGQSPLQVLARRRDLAGPGPSAPLKMIYNRVQLSPGPWEVAIPADPNFYISKFTGPPYEPSNDRRADGWNPFTVGGGSAIGFTISSSPGSVHGTVKSGSTPVGGAPVFLEQYDLEPHRRLADALVTRTDENGEYWFHGLAPGNYRVLSSFEYQMPDSKMMSNADAKSVKVDEGSASQLDLDLFGSPR